MEGPSARSCEMTSHIDRTRYRSSGKFRVLRLLVCGLIALAVAGGLAVALYQVYLRGVYVVGIAPLLAAAVGAGVVYLMIGLAHCRNRWLAGALGVVAGLVLYIGSYCAGMTGVVG